MRTPIATEINTGDVYAIIVAYNSSPSRIDEQLQRVGKECCIVIVDNSTHPQARENLKNLALKHHAIYLCMDGNVGVAKAQNRGAAYALSNRAKFLLLLDDDSLPAEGMVATLRSTFENLLESGSAAIVCGMHMERGATPVKLEMEVCSISNMMSSGSLISADVFNAVGSMDEGLFVDYVDFDWGWRAQRKGYKIFLVPSATFDHSLGEGNRRIFFWTIRIPAPVRHYFQFRNTLLLARRKHVPLKWKFARLFATPTKLVILFIITGARWKRLSYATKGIFDGLLGRAGNFR